MPASVDDDVEEGLPVSHDANSLSRMDMLNLTCPAEDFHIVFMPAGVPTGYEDLVPRSVRVTDDGLVMQIHPGVQRGHDTDALARFGPDLGADFPVPTGFTAALQRLLTRFGSTPAFRAVVFTVDETTFSRELAPMASYYPGLWLGAPWWFLDAPGCHVEVLGRGHRERRVWQVGRLRGRHSRLLFHPGPARPGPPSALRLPGPSGG